MKKIYYGNIIAAAAFVVWLTVWGTYATFGIFLKPITSEFGWERGDMALAYSLSALVQALSALVMGRLTDKLGPRFIVTVFGSCLAAAYLLLARITSIGQFQVTYALLGAVGLSTATVPIMTTIARWFARQRGTVTGIVQSGMGIGGLIFAPLTGWLIVKFDWRTAYFSLGMITLPLIVLAGLLLKRDPGGNVNSAGQEDGLRRKAENRENVPEPGLSLQQAMRIKQFWMIAGMFFSFGFCRSTFLAHTAAYVQDLGYALSDGANVMAVLTFSSILGRMGLGLLADKTASRTVYLLSFGIMITALFWGRFTDQLWGIFLFAVLFGISWGGQAVLRFTFTAEMFGLMNLGVITGILGLTEAGAAAFGSFFAGVVFDLAGTYKIMFTLGAILSLGGLVLAYLTKPPGGEAYEPANNHTT
ncbi:MAG: MFS transporter [Peptococcaceae bacterium]